MVGGGDLLTYFKNTDKYVNASFQIICAIKLY